MTSINKQAANILDRLFDLAKKNENYYKLNNSDVFMPLTIELINENEISICHYGEQNGDLMRDPEMIFHKTDGLWAPYYFRNDYLGIESIYEDVSRGQSELVRFANTWLKNIKEQHGL